MGLNKRLIFGFFLALATSNTQQDSFKYQSDFMRVELARDQPTFVALTVDSLGKRKLDKNPVKLPPPTTEKYRARHIGSRIEYHFSKQSVNALPAWSFEISTKKIRIRSHYLKNNSSSPLILNFNPEVNHTTLLGLTNDNGSVNLPAILHFPDLGTFRISSNSALPIALSYDVKKHPEQQRNEDYIRVTFPPASAANQKIEYTLEVVAIYPKIKGIEQDPRFDGFRRNWLSIFQLNPRLRVLANNAASDPCAFTVYMYSSMATHTPPLAPGLTALDLVRQTLDRYISGLKAYGIAGFSQYDVTTYLDSYPSLLIAAHDYVRGSGDWVWLENNYSTLRGWASQMLATDRNSNGLIEYVRSGNSGSWPWPRDMSISLRPSNWWDTIGFGHEDAYANALAYRALQGMTELAGRNNRWQDVELYSARARELRSVYFDTFYNPATGILAGWKSADGKLHDYYFLFVNGAAITYGLIPDNQANKIMDRLLAKMKEVGYDRFEYGLPGNLIPIRQEDYTHLEKRWGGPEKEDGSDAFQIYENGGATSAFAYFTLDALYKLSRWQNGDMIMLPMLRAFENGGFQGRGPKGMTYDWKAWDGIPHGYEGLLVDGYQALLAILTREQNIEEE